MFNTNLVVNISMYLKLGSDILIAGPIHLSDFSAGTGLQAYNIQKNMHVLSITWIKKLEIFFTKRFRTQ